MFSIVSIHHGVIIAAVQRNVIGNVRENAIRASQLVGEGMGGGGRLMSIHDLGQL